MRLRKQRKLRRLRNFLKFTVLTSTLPPYVLIIHNCWRKRFFQLANMPETCAESTKDGRNPNKLTRLLARLGLIAPYLGKRDVRSHSPKKSHTALPFYR